MLLLTGVKLSIGRSGRTACEPEESAEGVERVEPPIEAERELVEVGLQVFGADTVMDAVEPGPERTTPPESGCSGCGR